jgi:hypothetical protein
MKAATQSLLVLAAGLSTAILAAAPALAREVYDDLYFVKPQASAEGLFQDRDQCRREAQGQGGTAAAYSNPEYGALSAMGSALDEDALHEGGLHKRMQKAIFEDCMKHRGWTPLQPEGEDAKAVERASLRHPEALNSWLKSHEPAPTPPAAAAAATAAPKQKTP